MLTRTTSLVRHHIYLIPQHHVYAIEKFNLIFNIANLPSSFCLGRLQITPLSLKMAPRSFTTFVLLLCLFIPFHVHAAAMPLGTDDVSNLEFSAYDRSRMRRNDKTNACSLRILPLGASITWGQNSASGNGYRKPLRDRLQWQGYEVDMVGSRRNGNMKDNVIF